MFNNLFDSFNWNAKQFYTAPELEDFLYSVKVNLIEKPIDKILVMGHIYTSVGLDEHENCCVKYAEEDDWFIEENRYENEVQSIPTH